MPLGKDVSQNIKTLRKEKPHWTKERITAAALEAARRNGNKNVAVKED